MLVLSRKPSQRLLIGPDIVITVVRIGPNTVRLGIDAPGDVTVLREELGEPEPRINPEWIANSPEDIN